MLTLCVAVLLGACSERQDDMPAESGRPTPQDGQYGSETQSASLLDGRLLVTRDGESLPDECSLARVGEAMLALFDAVEAGDLDAIERAFAPARTTGDLAEDAKDGEIGFQWYTMTVDGVTEGSGGASQVIDRETVGAYFAERFGKHERMRVLVFDARRQDSLPSSAGGSLVVARAADDLPQADGGELLAHGKYGVNCRSGTFFALSLASDTRAQVTAGSLEVSPCPLPEEWRPDGPTIACAP